MKKKLGIACISLAVGVALFSIFLMPRTWNWGRDNLQVHIHILEYTDLQGEGHWDGDGFGWSKGGVLLMDLWRKSTGSRATTKGRFLDEVSEQEKATISGVSPSGVWVHVIYQRTKDGAAVIAFDKTIFVPSRGIVRLDISEKAYLTGEFTQG